MSISRRDALLGATAAVVVTGATVAPLAVKAALATTEPDAELIALGQQWRETYTAWLQCCGDEEKNSALGKRAFALEGQIAGMPAHSPSGALVKLRVAAEHFRVMGEIETGKYALLTYQAWQALETEPVDFEHLDRDSRPTA